MSEMATTTGTKLLGRMGAKYGVEADKLLDVLRDTVFSVKQGDRAFSNTEIAAALVLSERYGLDPFAKQIYLTRVKGKILVIVPVDGWTKLVNDQKTYEGCEFSWTEDDKGRVKSCTCKMHRSDRKYPTIVEEFMDECFAPKSDSDMDPWRKWPRRMLRHKAYIQCARLAFSLGGVVDPDEADRYVEVEVVKPRERELTIPEVYPNAEYKGKKLKSARRRATPVVDGRVFTQDDQQLTPADNEPSEQEKAGITADVQALVDLKEAELAGAAAYDAGAERSGLLTSFAELWQRHGDVGIDAAGLYGVTEDVSETSTADLGDLVAMMSETLSSETPQ